MREISCGIHGGFAIRVIVLLHPVVVGHFKRSIDIGFTGPPLQDSTEPEIAKSISWFYQAS
jgi:hypothetical protein